MLLLATAGALELQKLEGGFIAPRPEAQVPLKLRAAVAPPPLLRPLGAAISVPAKLVAAYNNAVESHPVATNVITGGGVMGLGDFCCQQLLAGAAGGYDVRRTLHAVLVGTVWQGVCIRKIFAFADGLGDRILKGLEDVPKWVDVLVRTLIMQCVLSTVGNYFNMSSRRLLAGGYRDVGAMVRGINACFLDVLITDWSVWPLYLGAAFAFVPPRMRSATTAVVNACWGVYISLMTARAAAPL